tara:strand:- start:288 stop:659 length:372 start_codon:yes stop_codon:yes gene_type:complete
MKRGFTLLEVLVTLVILGTVLAVVAQGFTWSGRATGEAAQESLAVMLADMKISELETGEISLMQGDSGDFEEYENFRYEIETDADEENEGLYSVSVSIFYKEGEEDRSYVLHRLIRERPGEGP